MYTMDMFTAEEKMIVNRYPAADEKALSRHIRAMLPYFTQEELETALSVIGKIEHLRKEGHSGARAEERKKLSFRRVLCLRARNAAAVMSPCFPYWG